MTVKFKKFLLSHLREILEDILSVSLEENSITYAHVLVEPNLTIIFIICKLLC